MPRLFALCVILVAGLQTALDAEQPASAKPQAANEDGFKPLFNGKDLTGWVNVNCAPGTFFVKDDMIVTTGKPTGYLRTDRQYENFIAEFDWFHVPPKKGAVGNSGFFVWCDPLPAVGTGYTRGIEVQVLVNLTWKDKKSGKETATSQGDLFSIWGARCKPDRPHPLGWERCLPNENRQKGEFEWNHFRVEANNGVIKLAVNGKVVSGISACNPRKGYLGLESEGSECRFKNLKIKELPSTHPNPSECADVDKGFKSMFTGVDLSGWTGTEKQKSHWKIDDGVLICDNVGKHLEGKLTSAKSFGDFEMVFNWQVPKDAQRHADSRTILRMRGDGHVTWHWREWPTESFSCLVGKKYSGRGSDEKISLSPAGKWNRVTVRMKGDRVTVRFNGKRAFEDFEIAGLDANGPIAFDNEGPVRVRNIFIRELKGDE